MEDRRLRFRCTHFAGAHVVAEVRRYPVLSSLVVGAIALLGPRRILDWGSRAITLYALLKGCA